MSDIINRRHFLVSGAATGLTLAGVPKLKRIKKTRAPNQKLLVGVMGTGGRGTGLASAFQRQPGVEVAYVCDVDQTRAERAAATVQKISNRRPRVVTDFRRILDDKAVDILVVATCNHWHAPAAILACAADKHVYVEKPCSHNPREGELLVQAARKNKRHVQMGNQRRSWPKVIEGDRRGPQGRDRPGVFGPGWYINNRPTHRHGARKPRRPRGSITICGKARPRAARSAPTILHYNWHWFWHWGNGELGNNGIHFHRRLPLGPRRRSSRCASRPPADATASRTTRKRPTRTSSATNSRAARQIIWEGLSCSRMPTNGRMPDVIFHGETGTLAINGGGYMIHDPAGKELRSATGSAADAVALRQFPRAHPRRHAASTAKSKKRPRAPCYATSATSPTAPAGRLPAIRRRARFKTTRRRWRIGRGNIRKDGSRGCRLDSEERAPTTAPKSQKFWRSGQRAVNAIRKKG